MLDSSLSTSSSHGDLRQVRHQDVHQALRLRLDLPQELSSNEIFLGSTLGKDGVEEKDQNNYGISAVPRARLRP